MKNALLVAIPFVTALAGVGAGKIAQDRYTVQVKINAAINEPDKVAPTAERLATVKLPDGFKLTKFAGIENPRWLVTNTDGTVYVSQRVPGTVTMLKDLDGDGVADAQTIVFRRKLSHGLAIHKGMLYVVTVNEVYRAPIMKDGTLGVIQQLIKDLPDGGQHLNRTIAFGPDGKMYISVGSTCNACNESSPESATMLVADADGKNRRIFASGLRNTIGFGWHPVSGRLFGMDHGIDWLGDDEQPEEFNEIVDGKRYGWPYIYADGQRNPQDVPPNGLTMEDWDRMSERMTLGHTAHAAAMQLRFAAPSNFPADAKRDAFATFRGSWNRAEPSGYEVVRVRFGADGAATAIEPFLTGFLARAPGGEAGWTGRPTGLAFAADGSMLVTDSENGVLYRVRYTGADATAPAAAFVPAPVPPPPPGPIAVDRAETRATAKLTVTSPAFAAGRAIPPAHSDYYENVSPPLAWNAGQEGTRAYAVIVDDPDASPQKPVTHWLAWNIPAETTALRPGLPDAPQLADPKAMRQGATTPNRTGYYGPRPPVGDRAHRYHFQVFALDTPLAILPGADRVALLEAMAGHVLAKGDLVGTYAQAKPPVK